MDCTQYSLVVKPLSDLYCNSSSNFQSHNQQQVQYNTDLLKQKQSNFYRNYKCWLKGGWMKTSDKVSREFEREGKWFNCFEHVNWFLICRMVRLKIASRLFWKVRFLQNRCLLCSIPHKDSCFLPEALRATWPSPPEPGAKMARTSSSVQHQVPML